MVDQILQDLETQGFSFVPNLIDSARLTEMNEFILRHKSEFEEAKVGNGQNRKRVESIRGDFTFWLDPLAPEEPFKSIITFLEELKNAINAKFFLGLKQFECHLAFYPPGTFYKKHLDRFEMNSSRSVSFVFYLNQEWSDEKGGELVFYNKQNEEIRKIIPSPGSFVCFLSDEFPHEVKSASIERRSLTGWMHTRIIY